MAGAKKLILINRTREKAWALARSIKRLVQKTDVVFDPEACDLVIQATSLGLHPSDPLPIPPKYLRAFRARYLFDMIYRPARTRMMKSAAKEGCQVANGLSMLLHQGAEAFEIWTGRKAPIKAMRKALMKELKTGQ